MPTGNPITVVAIHNDVPVAGASVGVNGTLTSDPFTFMSGANRTVQFIPGYSNRTTDASGSVDFMFYPTTGATIDISASASIGGVTRTGTLTGVSADATGTYTVVLP